MKNNMIILEGTKRSRLYALLTGYDYNHIYSVGIVTSENPMGIKSSRIENDESMCLLKKYLKSSNYAYLQAKGKYGNIEHSLIIQNPSEKFMRKVATKYNQKSYIYGQLYTSKDIKGMKFEYYEQVEKEIIISDKDFGKVLKSIGTGQFNIISTRYTYIDPTLDPENGDDNYTIFKGKKFQVPFFDEKYEEDIIEEEVGLSLRTKCTESIDKEELYERVNKLKRSNNKTERYQWESRGVIGLMLRGKYRGNIV